LTGCNSEKTQFPADDDMLMQWKREQHAMLSLANECRKTKVTYSFPALYSRDIPTNTIDIFEGCKLKQTLTPKENIYQLVHTARSIDKNQVIFVTNQLITKKGWWIWEEPILEEKGFIYVS
jgi:hypothetical protein